MLQLNLQNYLNVRYGVIQQILDVFVQSSVSFCQLRMIASDQATPERFGYSDAFITVVRDQGPPFFINQPYQTTINELDAVGRQTYVVTARDNDLVVSSYG